MTKKGLEIRLPTVFETIDLGNPVSEDKSREAIKKYQGHIVLLGDTHNAMSQGHYNLGIPKVLKDDTECYSFQFLNKDKPQTLHYHDLERLMASPIDSFIPLKTL